MEREKLVELAYQRGKELTLKNRNYQNWLKKFFEREYEQDVGVGDITSQAILTKNKRAKAILQAKEEGVIAGIEEASWFWKKHGLKVRTHVNDGDEIDEGSSIMDVYGNQNTILATERTSLNVLQRMSGIATQTRKLVDLLKGYHTRVAATRKTHWRYLDKKAVFLGRGLTHRLGLWDSILIKDNHLQALKNEGVKYPVEEAIARASQFAHSADFIEIETTKEDDALTAARKFKQLALKKPCIIMLDNMESSLIEQIIRKLRDETLFSHVLLEASGNITPENIKEYARTGIDVVSLGYLTHSAKAFDMSLEMTT